MSLAFRFSFFLCFFFLCFYNDLIRLDPWATRADHWATRADHLVDVTTTNQRNVRHRSGLGVLESKYVLNITHTIVFNDFTPDCQPWYPGASGYPG